MSNYKAAYFNGISNYVLLPKSATFDRGVNDFTFNCWFICYSFMAPTLQNLFGCMYPQSTAVSGIGFQTAEGSTLNNIYLYINGTGYWGVTNLLCNNWYMLTVTRTGTSLKFYLNNSLLSTVVVPIGASVNFSGNWNSVIGGGKHGTSNYYHNGLIEEVSLFNRVLTALEISYIYNSGNGRYADPTDVNADNPYHNGGMLAVYHLSGDLLDISGNNLNGVFMNAAIFADGKIVNPNAPVTYAGKWYFVDYATPDDLSTCYIRLADNQYPPIKCIYYSTTQTFISISTGTSYNLTQIYQWSKI